ncbi:tRNA dihydrouridine synthase [Pontiella sulfatireligans]|uniref:tRNA-dihydrouridine synthase n=1 Tax=Pontiella sulfatireligans TaxID=2750658 RepID=A0A6C2UM86_9BACT|nr:tRNA-dihydrouridine synthase family protein [Pontiella sulfatireligans]VGO21109.1 putative tRNA-dihydrouridine synthase [Pontiella sulfatireligans]
MQLPPLKFGSVEIGFPVVLAPMAGYTDAAMRTLCLEHGAGAVYTELTSAEGIRRDSKKTFQVLEAAQGEHPIAGHIFGRDPQAMAEAAKYVEQAGIFDWIDLNCGCPVKKVVSRGAGAALLKDLPLMGEIIEKVKAAVSLPVSVKTRIGFNRGTADHLEIAKVVEQSGADMIAVHARLAKNFHGGDPDWNALGEMKQALNIPIIGNGGVFEPADARRMVEASGVDGVMIGRGAIGNPWIFEQIKAEGSAEGSVLCFNVFEEKHHFIGLTPMVEDIKVRLGANEPPKGGTTNLYERRNMMAEHLQRMVALNELKQQNASRPCKYPPEEAACIQFRTHIPYYVKGLFDKKQLLMKLAHLLTVDAIMEEVDILVEKNKRDE